MPVFQRGETSEFRRGQMNDKELAKLVEEAYDRYFLAKAKSNSSSYAYRSDVFKFMYWLRNGKLPEEDK
jgi:hypothetical protein